jgi:hypothetical protein
MSILRLILIFLLFYYLLRLLGKVFSVLTNGKRNSVRGQSQNPVHIRKKQDIEDADYEEL